jgi:hypothetical protein
MLLHIATVKHEKTVGRRAVLRQNKILNRFLVPYKQAWRHEK